MDQKIVNIRISMKMFLSCVCVIACIVSYDVQGDIIPEDRRISWDPGIPGGVPFRTTIFANVKNPPFGAHGDGVSDDTAAIQNALNLCPSNQVVYLPAGTYLISSNLQILHSGITMRGDGPGVTILDAYGTSGSVIAFQPARYIHQGPFLNIIKPAAKGATNITVDALTGVSIYGFQSGVFASLGGFLGIDQINDTNFVTNVGSSGAASWVSRESGTRAMGQIVQITSINGNTIGFTPPLYYGYSTNLAAQACPFNNGNMWSGVEALTIRANHTGYTSNFRMDGAAYCWLKNVEGDYTDGDHVQIFNSYRCEVRDSYFHDAFHHTPGSTDADVMLALKTTACLIENNIFWRLHVSVILNWGAAGNVIGYNYSSGNFDQTSTNAVMMDMSCHGAHPMFNLWEGNISPKFQPDCFWGSSSHGTAFRNWFKGITYISAPINGRQLVDTNITWVAFQSSAAVKLQYLNWYYNVVGNILGCAEYTNGSLKNAGNYMYAWPDSAATAYEKPWVYYIGDANGVAGLGSTNTLDTTMIHGNWDFVTGAQKWVSTNGDHSLPASLYYSNKPAWFGNFPWPPIDPAQPAACYLTNLPAAQRLYLMNPYAFALPPINTNVSQAITVSGNDISQGVGTGTNIIGGLNFGSLNRFVAQKFVAGESFTIRSVLCKMSKTGDPGFNVTASVYSFNTTNGMPLSVIGNGSAPLSASLIATNQCDVIFTNLMAPVKVGSAYWLVLQTSQTAYPNSVTWHYGKSTYDKNPAFVNSGDGTTWHSVAYSWAFIFTPFGARSPSPPTNLHSVNQ